MMTSSEVEKAIYGEVDDFVEPVYWKDLFQKIPFNCEYYGGYNELSSVLENYCKRTDRILFLECDRTNLAEDMYKNGYKNMICVHSDRSVVFRQNMLNKSGLVFENENPQCLSNDGPEYDVMLEKSYLDENLPRYPHENAITNAINMFREVHRKLNAGGRFISVSLAQQHILHYWYNFFAPFKQYILRAHKVENRANGLTMPVFLLVATKMKSPMDLEMPMEVIKTGTKTVRVKELSCLIAQVKLLQGQLCRFINQCAHPLRRHGFIEIPRKIPIPELDYCMRIYVVDEPMTSISNYQNTFNVYYVPYGRDFDFMLCTSAGREALRKRYGYDRLVIVVPNRYENFTSLQAVMDQIAHYVCRLDNRPGEGKEVSLTINNDVNTKNPILVSRSTQNEYFIVEAVRNDFQKTRKQLVFLNKPYLIQSECFVDEGDFTKNDINNLCSLSNKVMIASLCLSNLQPLTKKNIPIKIGVLGLGGGVLSTWLIKNLEGSHVTSVDWDPEMVKVAVKYFGYPNRDHRCKTLTEDAAEFIERCGRRDEASKLDVLFVDIDGVNKHRDDDGKIRDYLHCPSGGFFCDEAFEDFERCVKKDGMIAIHCLAQDDDDAAEQNQTIQQYIEENDEYSVHLIQSVCEVIKVMIIQMRPHQEMGVNLDKAKERVRQNLPCRDELIAIMDNISVVRPVGE